ncbi:alpha/beta hydrolase [Bacillus vallismortis]|uniref:alpha/beta fold hydrolase n=1 Tax=Bacillus TaxID=1386 RepID=UPI00057BD436|nr:MULTISPECIES: alpha/beta hydrolase [Bacillus]PJZ00738.1 alpha/beta hydrolase [Bacillus vallismortis]
MELFRKDGSGTPIVFVSGLFAGNWIWEDTISYISKTEYSIIQQLDPLSAYGGKISDLREKLLGFFNDSIDSKAVIVGNSLGGLLAMELASLIPEKVAAIVASGAPGMGSINLGIGPPKKGSKEESKEWFRNLSEQLFVDQNCVNDKQLELLSEFFSNRRSFINMVRLAKEADRYDAKLLLPKIECPTLMLWGDQDKVSPIEPWEKSLTLNPQIQLQVIENSGHSPMMEKPKEFWHSVDRFLNNIQVPNMQLIP